MGRMARSSLRAGAARAAAPVRVLQLLADLRPMAAVGPVSLGEVRRVLLPRLAQLDRDPPKSRFGHVFVATPDALRGRTFRVVFVVGLAERVFPQRSREDPLLLDAMRKALAAPLAVEDDRVHGERVRLRLAVGAATERCWLSYPRPRRRPGTGAGAVVLRAGRRARLDRRRPGSRPLRARHRGRDRRRLAWPAPDDPAPAIDVGSTTWPSSAGCCGRRPMPPQGARPTTCWS